MTTASYTLISPAPGSASLDEGFFEITNHGDLAVSKFLEQFKTLPRFETLMRILTDQVQEIEVVLWDLLTERALNTAIGVQLDVIGRIVGQGRLGLEDDDYRVLLQARILVNRSDGEIETMLQLVRLMVDPDDDTTLTEPEPASMLIVTDTAISFDASLAFLMLNLAKAAGVRLVFVYLPQDPDDTFQFSSQLGVVETDANQGYSLSTTPTVGGGYAGAFAS